MLAKKSSYGVELRQPSKRDTRIYERYVKLGEACVEPVTCDKRNKLHTNNSIDIYPTSVFKLGSIHGVEPPPVNRQDQDIYNNYIMCGLYGPKTVSKVDLHCYNSYISHKYS